jgi:hypothetical protein
MSEQFNTFINTVQERGKSASSNFVLDLETMIDLSPDFKEPNLYLGCYKHAIRNECKYLSCYLSPDCLRLT